MRISDWSSDVCSSDLLGADSSFRRPMAVAVIGGLLTSTALSLLVVPVVFSYLDGFERRLRRWLRRGPQDLPSPSERPSARKPPLPPEVGRASCRARVGQYV